MPISIEINQDLNTIIRTVTDGLTSTDIKATFAESISHPDFKINMHVIWDLTAADPSKLSAEQLMDVVNYIKNNIDERGADYKIILVAPLDLSFGVSRMFESYGDSLPTSIHVLRNLDEAYKLISS